MISARLLSNDGRYAGDVLRETANDCRFGLDLALYESGKFSASFMLALGDMDARRKSMHLNHYSYSAEDMIMGMDFDAHRAFLRDVEFAGRANIRNAVLHWARSGHQSQLPSTKQITEVLSTFEQKDILPVIENLMVGFDWQRRLIEIAIKSGQPFGVCFDIGHAKIWGKKPLGAWLDWLDDLHAHDIPLIFHLHGNRGTNDDHLPLWMDEADCEASCVANDFAPDGIIPEIKTFHRRYPGSLFVLETGAEFAMENIRWARQHLLEVAP